MAASPWGPVLGGRRPWAGCRLAAATPVGYAQLVEGVVERLELHDLDEPLAWLHGRYATVAELDDPG